MSSNFPAALASAVAVFWRSRFSLLSLFTPLKPSSSLVQEHRRTSTTNMRQEGVCRLACLQLKQQFSPGLVGRQASTPSRRVSSRAVLSPYHLGHFDTIIARMAKVQDLQVDGAIYSPNAD
jgi:hypothetical protein